MVFAQAKKLWPFLLQLYALPLLGLCAVTLASLKSGIAMREFMADPSSVANIHPFVGVVSNFGVLLWGASAAICLFSSATLQHRISERGLSNFLRYAGLQEYIWIMPDGRILLANGANRPVRVILPDGVIYGFANKGQLK